MDAEAVVFCGAVGGGGGGEDGLYFTGDSFSRKSRRPGSRSRRGSLLVDGDSEGVEENQPIGDSALLSVAGVWYKVGIPD